MTDIANIGLGKGHPRFQQILDEMLKLHQNKDHDYALKPLDNLRECESIGVPAWKGAWIRMSDKWSRIRSIIKKDNVLVVNESLRDSLLDLANYAVLMIILLEESDAETKCKCGGGEGDSDGYDCINTIQPGSTTTTKSGLLQEFVYSEGGEMVR